VLEDCLFVRSRAVLLIRKSESNAETKIQNC
jgi:hypothetical protein